MDPELQAEQRYIDRAYACLAWMRARADEVVALTDPKEDLDLLHALRRRAASLTDGGRPLCFGRLDFEDDSTFHIGRRHVEDEAGDPVVVEWRAPVAVPFYRANPKDPMNLRSRRQFVVEGRHLHSMADDIFGADGPQEVPRLRGGDALLIELERSRGAEMLDIVATIQAEQDEVIRAPRAGVLVVQGAPGSGKTAVGLHRAAFLLYGDESLARQGVLVLGPNRVFLRYISQVLPSLGEDAVVQTTVRDLVSGVRVVAGDHPAAERVKGDGRMAAVLANALNELRRDLEEDLVVPVGLTRLVLGATEASEQAHQVARRGLPYADGRGVLRDALVAALIARHPDAGSAGHSVAEEAIRVHRALATALDRLWPTTSPTQLVRRLLSNRSNLAGAARDLLSADEQRALRRSPTPTESLEIRTNGLPLPAWELNKPRPVPKPKLREPWTAADVALVDEASALINGRGRTYGHTVVDEAQDLSPMQIRMVSRRARNGSATLLGDLAQASGVWAPDGWETLIAHFAAPAGWRVAELRLGYRSPADVLEMAARLAAVAAPGVPPAEPVRRGRDTVRIVPAPDPDHFLDAVARETARVSEQWGSTAVIGAAAQLDALRQALLAGGLDVGEASLGRLDRRVTLISAVQAKGLEFDAVVVAEPAAIMADAPRGLRLLYVAITRPTQALSIVHSQALPAALTA